MKAIVYTKNGAEIKYQLPLPTQSGHSWRGRELQISDRKPVVQLRRIATLLIARKRRISL